MLPRAPYYRVCLSTFVLGIVLLATFGCGDRNSQPATTADTDTTLSTDSAALNPAVILLKCEGSGSTARKVAEEHVTPVDSLGTVEFRLAGGAQSGTINLKRFQLVKPEDRDVHPITAASAVTFDILGLPEGTTDQYDFTLDDCPPSQAAQADTTRKMLTSPSMIVD